jgi:hypothetical protein
VPGRKDRCTVDRFTLLALAVACLCLRVTPLWADGSGEITPFPLTGAFRATHREDRGRIAILDFAGTYDRHLDGGSPNTEARAVVAREFFRTHPDAYDFLVVFTTFGFQTDGVDAMHWGVQNQVQGIGLAPYDVSELFGSAGRLLGYIDMADLSSHSADPIEPAFEKTLSTLGHEVLHQWSGRVRFVDAQGYISNALLGRVQHGCG